MSDVLIEFRGVKKAFGTKRVYRGLNLTMMRGEVLTVCGGSGVGKSVMLKLLIGLLRADAGSIVFDGAEVTQMDEDDLAKLRQRIGMLFQSGALFDSLSVGQNVAYGLEEHYRHQMSQSEIADRVDWALSLVDLPGIEHMWPAEQKWVSPRFVADGTRLAVVEMIRGESECLEAV